MGAGRWRFLSEAGPSPRTSSSLTRRRPAPLARALGTWPIADKIENVMQRCGRASMTIHGDLQDVIRGELDDVERAIKRGDATRALRELDDAVTKLRAIARKLEKMMRAPRLATAEGGCEWSIKRPPGGLCRPAPRLVDECSFSSMRRSSRSWRCVTSRMIWSVSRSSSCRSQVRYWHKADIPGPLINVRFQG